LLQLGVWGLVAGKSFRRVAHHGVFCVRGDVFFENFGELPAKSPVAWWFMRF
jgi:hypothetical protein